jgi:hypothetical protein
MYEALHQRTIKIEIFTGEMTFSVWYQQKKNKFSHTIYTGRSCSFFFTYARYRYAPKLISLVTFHIDVEYQG